MANKDLSVGGGGTYQRRKVEVLKISLVGVVVFGFESLGGVTTYILSDAERGGRT